MVRVVGDVFFLFDSSSSISADDYKSVSCLKYNTWIELITACQIISDFNGFGSYVSIDPNHIRVAMSTFDSSAHLTAGDFNIINSDKDFVDQLQAIWRAPRIGAFGNNIDECCEVAEKMTKLCTLRAFQRIACDSRFVDTGTWLPHRTKYC